MGQLVGDGGGQEAGGAVDVHVGLPGVGAVEAGEVHAAHEAGEEHGFHPFVLKGQEGELLLQGVVDVGAVRQDLLPGHGEEAVFVPGNTAGGAGRPLREEGRHGPQVLRGHGLGVDAGLILKAVRPKAEAPQEEEQGTDGHSGAEGAQRRAVGPLSPAAFGPEDGNDAPDQIGKAQQDGQDVDDLHDGEIHPVAQLPQSPPQGNGDVFRQGVHQGPVSPAQPEDQHSAQRGQQPDMQFFVLKKKVFHGQYSFAAAVSAGRVGPMGRRSGGDRGFPETIPRRPAADGYTPSGDGQRSPPRFPAPQCGPASSPAPGHRADTPRSGRGK